jgi:chromate transporter
MGLTKVMTGPRIGKTMLEKPSLATLTRVFARIGVLSFGGPAAQIALMHRELVDRLKWLTEKEYLSALSFCMLLPGPEAMQLATYAGWRMHGTRGGLIAGFLFVAPGALVILALSILYGSYGQIPLIQALFTGIQAAVVVIVIEALLRVARRALKGPVHWVIAASAFLALFAFHVPFWAVILIAGALGYLTAKRSDATANPIPPTQHNFGTVAMFAAAWGIPLGLLGLFEQGLLWEMALFFSNLAIVTFGGAYAVLAAMTQTVVNDKGWLTLPQMIDALGLAETTPGPLILVTEFVGYLAAYKQGGIWFGIAGAIVTLWMTFVPCFLWVFAGAPYISRLGQMPRLSGALAAITAAVVGVIANLTIWFAAHVAFDRVGEVSVGPARIIAPEWSSLDPLSIALTALAALLILRLHQGLALTLGLCGGLAVVARLSGIA